MIEIITSSQNEKIKQLTRLSKHRERQKTGLTLVDGGREIKSALVNNWEITEIFYCPDLIKDQELLSATIKLTALSEKIFRKLSLKENPDGYLAIAKIQKSTLTSLKLRKNPLLVILESVEKPGNLGAIIRTATAANVDAIIVADEQTDIYHPNVIRASQGHIFKQPIIAAKSEEIIAWLKANQINSYAAATKSKKIYTDINWQEPSAIVLGTESQGLTEKWLKATTAQIKIPMVAGIDSLNVSVSAAILVYEAARQRNFVDIIS